MQGWKWAVTLSIATMLASLYILVILPLVWELRILFGVLAVLSGFAWARFSRLGLLRQYERKRRDRQAKDEQEFIGIMNHVRHNWMNELQILYGYIQLKKYDKLLCAVEKIKAKAQQESHISRLGVPSLVAFLFYYKIQQQKMELEVEMAEEIDLSALPLSHERVADLIREVIVAFAGHADAAGIEPNVLSLELDLLEDGLLLDFMFRGTLDAASAQAMIGRILLEYALEATPEGQEYETAKAAVAIRVPFQADRR